MMDMLPTAIGLLVWSNHTPVKGQDQDQGKDQGGERFFEPVLHKGMRLPCTSRHTFTLATGDYSTLLFHYLKPNVTITQL